MKKIKSISILKHNINLENTFEVFSAISLHCTEEIPPIAGLCRIRLYVFVTSFKRKNV